VLYIPAYKIFGPGNLLLILSALVALTIPLEILRLKKGYFKLIAREHEMMGFGAHIYFMVSILLVTLFFPEDTCFIALITSIVGDGFAGIARKIYKNETVASFSMFFSSAYASARLNLLDIHSLLAVILGTTVERMKKVRGIYIQDNFSFPLATTLMRQSVKYISSHFCF